MLPVDNCQHLSIWHRAGRHPAEPGTSTLSRRDRGIQEVRAQICWLTSQTQAQWDREQCNQLLGLIHSSQTTMKQSQKQANLNHNEIPKKSPQSSYLYVTKSLDLEKIKFKNHHKKETGKPHGWNKWRGLKHPYLDEQSPVYDCTPETNTTLHVNYTGT